MGKIKRIRSEAVCLTVPETLKLELNAIPETGYYDSTSEFFRDAVRSILAARKDLRIAIATTLYKKGKISLGKAAEIADVNYDEIKKILYDSGIKRRSGTETKKEAEEGLKRFRKWKE